MSKATKYRKKPVVIDAVVWDGGAVAATPIINWILEKGGTARWNEQRDYDTGWPEGKPEEATSFKRNKPVPEHIAIDTREGTMRADIGDWILKGVQGEFYPCKPDIFEATYEAVVD